MATLHCHTLDMPVTTDWQGYNKITVQLKKRGVQVTKIIIAVLIIIMYNFLSPLYQVISVKNVYSFKMGKTNNCTDRR